MVQTTVYAFTCRLGPFCRRVVVVTQKATLFGYCCPNIARKFSQVSSKSESCDLVELSFRTPKFKRRSTFFHHHSPPYIPPPTALY